MDVSMLSRIFTTVTLMCVASPANAAPVEQIDCVLKEAPSSILIAAANQSIYGSNDDIDLSQITMAGSRCAAKLGWTADEQIAAEQYAHSVMTSAIASEKLAKDGINVEMIDAFVVENYADIERLGLTNLPAGKVDQMLSAAGVDLQNNISVAEAVFYLIGSWGAKSATNAFVRGRIAN